MTDPDGVCKHCGRGMIYKRKGHHVIKRSYCNGACRVAAHRKRHPRTPRAPDPPPPPQYPTPTLREDLQSYDQAGIINWLEESRLPQSIKMDIWQRWIQGNLPMEPKERKTVNDNQAFDKLIRDTKANKIITKVAIELAREDPEDRTSEDEPRVLRNGVPEGGDSP